MAAVNNWDNATKVLWLKARLTGRAQVAIQRLSKETLGDLQALTRAMKERFEPNCQTEMYWRKFQTRLKRSDKAWHYFADDLCGLVNKAIPHVQEEARQQLAVMRYLEQLSDTQVAFSVRQKRPKTLAEAVALTLETESLAIASGVSSCKERLRSLVAGTQTENSTTDINAQGLLTTLLQRMGKLEDTLTEARIHRPSPSPIVWDVGRIEITRRDTPTAK